MSPTTAPKAKATSARSSSPAAVVDGPVDDVDPPAPGLDDLAEPAAEALKVGGVVNWEYFDSYAGAGGELRTRTGVVVELVDVDDGEGGTTQAARVAWLDASDPIPADQLSAP